MKTKHFSVKNFQVKQNFVSFCFVKYWNIFLQKISHIPSEKLDYNIIPGSSNWTKEIVSWNNRFQNKKLYFWIFIGKFFRNSVLTEKDCNISIQLTQIRYHNCKFGCEDKKFWELPKLLYFMEYSVHLNFTMIFGKKIFFLFFKNNFTRINHCKFIHHKSHLKPFFSYLPFIVCREYFSIIFNVKKCAPYLIKYGTRNFKLKQQKIKLFLEITNFKMKNCTYKSLI